MTQAGMILGTAAYMSPEQARGKPVDRRADIWAFGAVLYEMLTGKRAFEDEDVSMTLSKVLQREPDFDALPPAVPARVGQAIRVCLRKDPKQRAGDIRDVRLALEGAFETTVPGTAAPAPAIQPRRLFRRALPVVAAAVVASAMVGAAAWMLKPTPPLTVARFVFALGEGQQSTVINSQTLALSPDGTRLVYEANSQLYLRSMSDLEALGGVLFAVPFDLRRLAVTGGPVPIVEGVKRSSGISGTAHFSVSNTGALVFVPGPASTSSLDLALVRGAEGARADGKMRLQISEFRFRIDRTMC